MTTALQTTGIDLGELMNLMITMMIVVMIAHNNLF